MVSLANIRETPDTRLLLQFSSHSATILPVSAAWQQAKERRWTGGRLSDAVSSDKSTSQSTGVAQSRQTCSLSLSERDHLGQHPAGMKMGTRDGAIARATQLFDGGGFRDRLAELVAIPSTSQDPGHEADVGRYLRAAMQPWLETMGFSVAVHENPRDGFGPILVAE